MNHKGPVSIHMTGTSGGPTVTELFGNTMIDELEQRTGLSLQPAHVL